MIKTILINDITIRVDSWKYFKNYPLKYWTYSKLHNSLYYSHKGIYFPFAELVKGNLPPLHEIRFINSDPTDLRAKNIYYYDLTPKMKNIKVLKSFEGHQVGHYLTLCLKGTPSRMRSMMCMYLRTSHSLLAQAGLTNSANSQRAVTSFISRLPVSKTTSASRILLACLQTCPLGVDDQERQHTRFSSQSRGIRPD